MGSRKSGAPPIDLILRTWSDHNLFWMRKRHSCQQQDLGRDLTKVRHNVVLQQLKRMPQEHRKRSGQVGEAKNPPATLVTPPRQPSKAQMTPLSARSTASGASANSTPNGERKNKAFPDEFLAMLLEDLESNGGLRRISSQPGHWLESLLNKCTKEDPWKAKLYGVDRERI